MGGTRTAAEQREYRLRRQEAARKAGRKVPSFSGSTNSGKETTRRKPKIRDPKLAALRAFLRLSFGESGFRLCPMIRGGWGATTAMKTMCPSNLTSDVAKLKWLKRKM